MTESEQQFAYGDWSIDGVSCPISTAAARNSRGAVEVAETFDDFVCSMLDDKDISGVVDAETAKEAWDKTVNTFERRHKEEDMYYKDEYELAKRVQSEVFE